MKRNILVLAVVFCLGLAVSAFADDYSADELSQYSRDEIEAMGDDNIELQIAYWEWVLAELEPQIDEWEGKVQPLRDQVDDLERRIAELERQINDLRAEINRLRNAGVHHLILDGETLWGIAAVHYHYGDGTQWPKIYERNRDKISDPNMIYAGDTIIVPIPMVNSYTVVEGDFLGKIAGYDVVYGDRGMWPQLYEGNRGKISNPNLIYPGQVLDVPRTGARYGRN
jgi:nucleoid-associated protein YgaU